MALVGANTVAPGLFMTAVTYQSFPVLFGLHVVPEIMVLAEVKANVRRIILFSGGSYLLAAPREDTNMDNSF